MAIDADVSTTDVEHQGKGYRRIYRSHVISSSDSDDTIEVASRDKNETIDKNGNKNKGRKVPVVKARKSKAHI